MLDDYVKFKDDGIAGIRYATESIWSGNVSSVTVDEAAVLQSIDFWG